MQWIFLPFFLAKLAFKNAVSWSKMGGETFGFPVALLCLLLLNMVLGVLLYTSYQDFDSAKTDLASTEERYQKAQQFWGTLYKEVPGHRQIEAAQKTLAE